MDNYKIDNYTHYESDSSDCNSRYRENFFFDNQIVELDNWIMHIDQYGEEYVIGNKLRKKSLWETSTIKEKIALSKSLLIITENESIYRLPYNSRY